MSILPVLCQTSGGQTPALACLQLSPPGMHMLHLCFADDIRAPEVDKNLVGTAFPEPSKEQIEKAEEIVERLTIQDGYVGMYESPLLQRHYQASQPLHVLLLASKGLMLHVLNHISTYVHLRSAR